MTLYLHRDTYRLLDYPDNLIEADDLFLKTSGAGLAATMTAAPDISGAGKMNEISKIQQELIAKTTKIRKCFNIEMLQGISQWQRKMKFCDFSIMSITPDHIFMVKVPEL